MEEKIREKLGCEIERIANELIASKAGEHYLVADSVERPEDLIARPTNEIFGDYTSNVALLIAGRLGQSPRDVATLIKERINLPKLIERTEVAGPGHLNFFLSHTYFLQVLQEILEKKNQYGSSNRGIGEKVNNEFISANPTGPLTVGNGRGGFYADSVARVLRKAGYEVTNEYYVNDAGEQVMKLGHSVLKDAEAVYGGEYIEQLAVNNKQKEVRETGEWAAKEVLEKMIKKSVAEKMQITFDVWTSEKKDVVETGLVERALKILDEKGVTYKTEEGTLWMRTTDFGDDKDRVLVKQDGVKTYFATDCGHILGYIESGVSTILETFGADHHGYTKRFEVVSRALGFTGSIHFTLVQLVKVVKDGVEVRMSKRAGNVVTIDELIDTVGHDVARFFFLMYAPETHMNFDLGLAEERSQKNPVYYVQYAHARLCSILRKAEDEGIAEGKGDLALLAHEKERELIRELMFFPELVETVAMDYSVHKLPQYAMRLADKFHSFYDACRVIDEEQKELTLARLELVRATRVVLAETLVLMGISAPEKM